MPVRLQGRLYIVMRLIDGADLQGVSAQGPLEPGRALPILEQIGDALDAAHAQVSYIETSVPATSWCGLRSRVSRRLRRRSDDGDKGLTRTGFFVGNLDYAAPEQIEGQSVDGRADIYALGRVLFTSLTGRTPFERESDVQVMYAHLNEAPPAPSAVREDLPPALDDVVAKAMAKTPDTRFQSCAEFVEALRTAVTPAGSVTSLPASALGNGAPAT